MKYSPEISRGVYHGIQSGQLDEVPITARLVDDILLGFVYGTFDSGVGVGKIVQLTLPVALVDPNISWDKIHEHLLIYIQEILQQTA